MRKYHHFLIAAEKPANEKGFTFCAIGDGKQIYRWDKYRTLPPPFPEETAHFMDGRIGNWESKSRLKFRVEFYTYRVALTRSVLNEWTGSGETEYLQTLQHTATGWQDFRTKEKFPNLFRAIRAAQRKF